MMTDSNGLLAHQAFRRIWLAGILAGVARWLEIIVVGIYVFQVTQSALQASLVAMLRMLPFGVAGPILGGLAERFGLRRMFLASALMATVVCAGQGLLAALEGVAVWHLALGSLLAGIYWAADLPLRRTMMTAAVGADRIVPAMAIDTTTINLTRTLGPVLGGVAYQFLGLSGAFLVATLMHGAAVVLIFRLDSDVRPTQAVVGFFRGLREGFDIARGIRPVLLALAMSLVFNLFGFPATSMIPVVGEQRYVMSASLVGLLLAAEGLGATLGSLLVVRLGDRIRFHGRFFALGLLTYLLTTLAFSLASSPGLAWVAMFAGGVGLTGFSTMQSTLVLMAAPAAARSRLMGLLALSIGTGPLGFLLLGWTADRLDAAQALRLMALEGLLAWALVAWWLRDVLIKPLRR